LDKHVDRQEGGDGVNEQRRKPWTLLLVAAGLALAALVLLLITAPDPTALLVRVIDAETGEPLPGASVAPRVRGGQTLPELVSDEIGIARFDDVPSDRNYVIRVQKVDYDLAFDVGVAVAEGQETEVTVLLTVHAGGRLFVGLDDSHVSEIDTASLSVMRTIRLPGWKQEPVQHVRFHPGGSAVYTVSGGDGCILDGESGMTLGQFAVDDTVDSLNVAADGQQLYTISSPGHGTAPMTVQSFGSELLPRSHELTVLDAYTGEWLTNTQIVDPALAAQVMWRPGGTEVYVLEPTFRSLWVLNAEPRSVLERLSPRGYPADGFVSNGGHYLYTWSTLPFEDLQLAFPGVLEPVPEVMSLPANPQGWALSPADEALYVLDAELGTLSIVDITGQEPPNVVAVGSRPVAITIGPDGRWAYVANQESQTISVIHLPTDTVLLTIPVLRRPYSVTVR
jgi:YVTN family beta-propeller protein